MVTMKKINDIKALGLLVREERRLQGLTQEQLAATCGVGIRFLRELEHGKDTCQIGKVIQVMKLLGLDIFAYKRGGSLS
jgi:y4mF family transcriptional regulator